jgi:hypothetical protein
MQNEGFAPALRFENKHVETSIKFSSQQSLRRIVIEAQK